MQQQTDYFTQRKREFDKLPKYKKRITVARDALAQLDAGKIIPKSGSWASIAGQGSSFVPDGMQVTVNTQVQQVIEGQTCQACVLGGLLLCLVNRTDELTVGQLGGRGVNIGRRIRWEMVFKYLGRFFSRSQLDLIEAAFERRTYGLTTGRNMQVAFDFTKGVRGLRQRMRLILENIVVNEGTFVPEQLPKVKTVFYTKGFKG